MGNGTSTSNLQEVLTEPSRTTLFTREPCGITYRIPALIYISEGGTFLAFAEKRSSSLDCDAKVLVMRRGTHKDGSIQWSPAEELINASLPGHRTMNPCPVYERKSKTLFLFFICVLNRTTEHWQICTGKNRARLCYITSEDSGLSWSNITDLTDNVIGHETDRWATFAVGPGHGIQMKSGRLIVPAYVYYIHYRCFPLRCPVHVKPHALAFYSDDRGNSWRIGQQVKLKSCECEMAEIIDQNGKSLLYCSARSTQRYRVEAMSENSGAAFGKPRIDHKLVEPCHGCQGSILSFDAPGDAGLETMSDCSMSKTWLLYSHPTNRRQRKALGIYLNVSPFSASAWGKPWIVWHGPSGYSDLARWDGTDRFACLMECGESSELEGITFLDFSLSDIMNNQQ